MRLEKWRKWQKFPGFQASADCGVLDPRPRPPKDRRSHRDRFARLFPQTRTRQMAMISSPAFSEMRRSTLEFSSPKRIVKAWSGFHAMTRRLNAYFGIGSCCLIRTVSMKTTAVAQSLNRHTKVNQNGYCFLNRKNLFARGRPAGEITRTQQRLSYICEVPRKIHKIIIGKFGYYSSAKSINQTFDVCELQKLST